MGPAGTIRPVDARRWGASALAAATLLGAACSDDDDAGPATTTFAVSIRARGEATLEGALAGTGTFELQYPTTYTSCAQLARLEAFVVPLPNRLDDARLQWEAATPKLDGPGQYNLGDFGTIRVTVAREGAEPVVYASDAGTTADLQLDGDAGGHFSFTGLRDPSGAELRGTSTWTCGPGA
jgi:hypothetical protein